MERLPARAPHPAFLPLGTVVGPWKVVDWAGKGVHGAVFRAVRLDDPQARAVALKVALLPRDPRFAREGELHSRLAHPSIPRLVDSGEWQHPGGTRHPYLAMEWVDGVPLYDWAREHAPDFQQVLRLLARLARALQVLHSQGAIHRDIKGDNVLVRRTDDHAVLTDFGSGHYPGAATLTPPGVFLGTPAYRSPEAWLFELRSGNTPTACYRAGPADDLYALGVTACRLVTGEYPELGEPRKDEADTWQLDAVIPPAALLHSPRVDPPLRALILRMLSVHPEERGTAAELAEAMEQAAGPITAQSAQPVAEEPARAERHAAFVTFRAHRRARRPWFALAAVGLAMVASVWWIAPGQLAEAPASARADVADTGQPDAGTVGLGDSTKTVSTESSPKFPMPEGLAEDTLPEPQPGQTRPDAKGRCPRKQYVALNGGCWLVPPIGGEDCSVVRGSMYKGTCYLPIIPPPGRRPTSSPLDTP